MSDGHDDRGMLRAVGWLGAGVAAALVGAAALTPSNAYDFGTIAPMLGIIALGIVITLVAGARGRRADGERRLLRRLDEQDRVVPGPDREDN